MVCGSERYLAAAYLTEHLRKAQLPHGEKFIPCFRETSCSLIQKLKNTIAQTQCSYARPLLLSHLLHVDIVCVENLTAITEIIQAAQ